MWATRAAATCHERPEKKMKKKNIHLTLSPKAEPKPSTRRRYLKTAEVRLPKSEKTTMQVRKTCEAIRSGVSG
jgi:hypothetical protein